MNSLLQFVNYSIKPENGLLLKFSELAPNKYKEASTINIFIFLDCYVGERPRWPIAKPQPMREPWWL